MDDANNYMWIRAGIGRELGTPAESEGYKTEEMDTHKMAGCDPRRRFTRL